MHRFCTVSAPFSGILKSPILSMNDLRCLFVRMVQFDLELPGDVFTETPISPSISRVFKGYRELIFHLIWRVKNHLAQHMTTQSKIQNLSGGLVKKKSNHRSNSGN